MEVTVAQIRSFLSDDEKKLAAYLIDVSKQGYGKRKEIILHELMVSQVAIKCGKEDKGCLSEIM